MQITECRQWYRKHMSEILLKKNAAFEFDNSITYSLMAQQSSNNYYFFLSNTNAFVFKLQQLNSSLSDTVVKTTVLIVL